MLDTQFMFKTFVLCLKAVPVTLKITIFSSLLAFIPALGIALGRIKKRKLIEIPGKIFVSFMRGTPVVLQILIVYSLFPSLINSLFKGLKIHFNIFDLNPIFYAYIVFTLNSIATLSEIFRSAILTVSYGQYEAALSCGLTGLQTYRRIILPQAAVSAIPNLSSFAVILIKNTSLAFMMTVKDITATAKIEASYSFNYIEAYLDIFVVYIIVCLVVQFIFKLLEKRCCQKDIKRTGVINA